jgi:hypothetical protein
MESGLTAFEAEPLETDQRIGVRMRQLLASADAVASRRFSVGAKFVAFASGSTKDRGGRNN